MAFLDELHEALEAERQPLTPTRVCELIRTRWPAERVYIAAKPPRPAPRPDLTPRQIRENYGISRSTSYQWAMKWRRQR